jgi:hypothetical protein
MKKNEPGNMIGHTPHCCPGGAGSTLTRRTFLKGVGATALGSVALGGLSWKVFSATESPADETVGLARMPLQVKPILVYSLPERRSQTSWRSWGGVQTQRDAERESSRIAAELEALKTRADFPLDVRPISLVRKAADLPGVGDLAPSDVFLVYAAGGWMDVFGELEKLGKNMIFFCRHKSGPVYLWYEIISPRYLRQHTDMLAVKGVDDGDVVIDSQDEILWRLRALAGLRNARGTKILAVGGPDAWSQPRGIVPRLVEEKWGFEMITIPYEQLGKLIQEARSDKEAVSQARQRAAAYLADPGISLETQRTFVDNAFLLDQVFRGLMAEAGCRAITINGCMGTIMPLAETSACLTLSLMNDGGYLAFCESDFVVIPSGVLLANISGKPVFLNDPTYPHDGVITLAHCTAPRKMDGERLEPARLLTHFESDYGAAPKVEMRKGQVLTNIVPDFKEERWIGLLGKVVDNPFLDICRSQIDIGYACDDRLLAGRMPGFHWMTGYGDYTREVGYALNKSGIQWELLG